MSFGNYSTGSAGIELRNRHSVAGSTREDVSRSGSTNDDNYDFLFKVVLVGNSGVGKSNLLSRFTRNEFMMDFRTTIGVEFATKTIDVQKKKIKTQIWDTAGQEKFRVISSAYFRNSMGAVLVYDISKFDTFDSLERWKAEIDAFAPQGCKIILVGNKVDLNGSRTVAKTDADAFAEHNGMKHIETSALTSENVAKMFHSLVEDIYESQFRSETLSTVDSISGQKLQNLNQGKRETSWCPC